MPIQSSAFDPDVDLTPEERERMRNQLDVADMGNRNLPPRKHLLSDLDDDDTGDRRVSER